MDGLILLSVNCDIATRQAKNTQFNSYDMFTAFRWFLYRLDNTIIKTKKIKLYVTKPLIKKIKTLKKKSILKTDKKQLAKKFSISKVKQREFVHDLVSSAKSISQTGMRIYNNIDYYKWCEYQTLVHEINNYIFNLLYVSTYYHYYDNNVTSCYNRLNISLPPLLGGGMFYGFRKLWIRRLAFEKIGHQNNVHILIQNILFIKFVHIII